MRDELEIQRAHDILVAVITGQAPSIPMDEKTRAGIKVAADVLCWVLNHGHNMRFEQNMAEIEGALTLAGGRLRFVPRSPD